MKRIIWMVQAAGFYCLTLGATLIPAALLDRLAAGIGFLLSCILFNRRKILLDNINRALPFMEHHPLWTASPACSGRLARENFQNMGRSLIEVCWLYHDRGEEVVTNIDLRGREHFEAAQSKGKGMICVSGHCGNWELMALAIGRLLGEGAVIANRQKNPYFDRMVERMRMRYNSRVIYKKGAFRSILTALKRGQLVGILADQAALPADGVLIEVMGRKAWASKAPVQLARKSGAPLVPVFIHREGERHVITFHPEHLLGEDLSEEGMRQETQALSRYVEEFVVAHPTQWYWVHRRWKRAGEAAEATRKNPVGGNAVAPSDTPPGPAPVIGPVRPSTGGFSG
ncbi:lysophospholipid acyltransferase family protein [Geomesophilobacter sediminis]|uniref:Lysophospholipid acyltransferase family protein n=1 Tax=Geomesophilobacter sediminis TaxID=2798584 RepID=A0A8J7M3E6_9BACT|nr:lysophospholipid acyltransferase family protein [Geomesophilobacter sediminis]MBJ6727952.1 lysophospholipid acyltransferase family protein [Geomesophilobacter sediminis]